jgi:endo-1,4-beta-xylanase
MMTHRSNRNLRLGWFTAVLLALGPTARSADRPTLKDAYKEHFYVGAAINRTIATGTAVRADNVNRTLEQVAKDIAVAKDQFNQIAPENDLKWALIHPREGADGYNFGPADAFVNFGLSNNMYVIGHTLVWHGQTPFWVFQGTNLPPGVTNASPVASAAITNAAGTNAPGSGRFGRGPGPGFGRGGFAGPRASREELLQRMREHIHTVVSRYKGKIKAWDVVNEAISDGGTNILRNSLWLEIIGPDFVAKAFEYAHEADPDAILRYNDYGLENPAKRRKLITLIKSLQEQKVPVMAIGTQAHLNVSTSFEAMDQALTEMETLGLPIHVTELDVNSAQGGQRNTSADISSNAVTTQGGLVDDANRRLADAYAGLFRAFLKHKNSVKMVTFWGVNDGVSWRANGKPLLFDGNNQPKPAFDAVISEAIKAMKEQPSTIQ